MDRCEQSEALEGELYTPERLAYFMLINSMTKEEWDLMITDVIAMGLDPTAIEGIDPNHRDTLPTDAEWDARIVAARANARTAIESEPRISPFA